MIDERIENKLRRWGKALDDCYRKQQEIDRLKQMCVDALSPSSPVLTGTPKATTVSSSVESAVERIIDIYESEIMQLSNEIAEIMCFKDKMDSIIAGLPDKQREVIYLRYWCGYKWGQIEVKMHYTEGHCKKIFRETSEKMIRNDTFLVL